MTCVADECHMGCHAEGTFYADDLAFLRSLDDATIDGLPIYFDSDVPSSGWGVILDTSRDAE